MKKLLIGMIICIAGCSVDYPKHAVIGTGGADSGDGDSTSGGCDGDSTSSTGGGGAGGQ